VVDGDELREGDEDGPARPGGSAHLESLTTSSSSSGALAESWNHGSRRIEGESKLRQRFLRLDLKESS
jgi:hypothetical protein